MFVFVFQCLSYYFHFVFFSLKIFTFNCWRLWEGCAINILAGKPPWESRAPMGRARAKQGTYLKYADFFPAFSRIFNLHNYFNIFFFLCYEENSLSIQKKTNQTIFTLKESNPILDQQIVFGRYLVKSAKVTTRCWTFTPRLEYI